MIEMSKNYYKEAKARIDKEVKTVKLPLAAVEMAQSVADALCVFAEQNNEFAQAIAQGESFADCMSAVAKSVERSIPDIEAYRRAVRFYFPTATVSFVMTIHTEGNNRLENEPKKESGISCTDISLDDLLEM